MVYINTTAPLEGFRRFLINSTCQSFIPESYWRDPEVFPEKEGVSGSIYVEAGDKVTLKKMRDITFINARDILGIIYVSKSGNSRLRWRQVRGRIGRVSGEASANSLVNLLMSRVITREYAEQLAQGILKPGEEVEGAGELEEEATPGEAPFAGEEEEDASTSESLGEADALRTGEGA